MDFFVQKEGYQLGPYSEAEIQSLVASGQFDSKEIVRRGDVQASVSVDSAKSGAGDLPPLLNLIAMLPLLSIYIVIIYGITIAIAGLRMGFVLVLFPVVSIGALVALCGSFLAKPIQVRGIALVVTLALSATLYLMWHHVPSPRVSDSGSGIPPIPPVTQLLRMNIRNSLLNSSTGVLQLRGGAQDVQGVFLEYENQNTHKTKRYSVGLIRSGELKEIGILESGWSLEADETVTISAYGGSSVTLYLYKDPQGNLVWSEGYAKKKAGQILQRLQEWTK